MSSFSPTVFPFPVIVGDIGGTNARFALQEEPDGPLTMLGRFRTADFPTVSLALAAATAPAARKPRSAILCGAGPVNDRVCALTNADWVIDGPEIVRLGGAVEGLLLNDFEAQALALPALPDGVVESIGTVAPGAGPRVVLGPGTGLGVGALVEVAGRFAPLPSEGGHVDFAPFDAEEERVFVHVRRVEGRLTAEAVLSGPGLVALHHARLAAAGSSAPDGLDGVAIVDGALAEHASVEADTVRMFIRLLARFAGDMAIVFGGTGGVTLAGGILPRIRPLLDPAAFRAAFERKEPVESLPRRIATRMVTSPDAVLHGMAAIASHPERYAVDYDRRLWSA
ncbi:glucokinase [Alsobacter metallidurans]|uniref:Glucokinase n=1 Tax=Alsobacter metallidurans TaxID=340221 RepID=A0A917MFG6_9HYPH|nr:glucokinase [Alsobacter metallidurans]GGH08447.1 glucokinase [Alsobacter metallidurans]